MGHIVLIMEDDLVKKFTTIRCAHGDVATYQLAPIVVSLWGDLVSVNAVVSSTLPQLAITGWDAWNWYQVTDSSVNEYIGVRHAHKVEGFAAKEE